MPKERKSPYEKKRLEYTRDHFTFGFDSSRMFPKTWKRKKKNVNREYRRKSEQLLPRTKPGAAADDVELVADDLTVARFKSVVRKRLHKAGTITLGEKVAHKLEKREELAGPRVQRRQHYDGAATSAISTLRSLDGPRLVDVVRRAELWCGSRNVDELKRVLQSTNPIDRALHFLYQVSSGSAHEWDAVRRNPGLERDLVIWMERANRILNRDKHAEERKIAERQETKRKLKAPRSR